LEKFMKLKLGLALSLATAAFVGSFSASQAVANIYPIEQCFTACYQQYQACLQATPDKATLCAAQRRLCIADCGNNI